MKNFISLILILFLVGCGSFKDTIRFPLPTFYYHGVPIRYEESKIGIYSQIKEGEGIIFIDKDDFYNFPESMQYFAIFHEKCHIVLETKDEFLADRCALTHIYNISPKNDKWFLEIYSIVSKWSENKSHPSGYKRAYELFVTYELLRETGN